jgi:hypothetical protein
LLEERKSLDEVCVAFLGGYIPIQSSVAVSISRPKGSEKNMVAVDDAWFLKNKKAMMKKFSKIMSGREQFSGKTIDEIFSR